VAELTVIVPTYNRKEILLKTLAAYQSQSTREEILEILVVDDGSTDGTAEAVSQFKNETPLSVRYLSQRNSGLAAARNHGIREAKGRLLLFGDDDIIPGAHLVAEHLSCHRKYPDSSVAVLGLVAWSPEVRPTPFMEWLASDGVLFDFGHLSREKEVDFERCYFCNTSLKAEFLARNGVFDEDFRTYGYEDTELAFRLSKRGLRMLYHPDAVGYHYKFVSFAAACRRAELVANAWRVLGTKEAGKYIAARRTDRNDNRRIRFKRLSRNFIVTILLPMKVLLDSRVRLPRHVYRWFYAFYTESKIEKAVSTAGLK
jgi:glycosyltransferase involved in cell wall biosynthesis